MGKLKIAIIIILILVGYIIITSNDLNLREKEDQKEFASLFSKLAYNVGKNTRDIVAYAIKKDWNVNQTEDDS